MTDHGERPERVPRRTGNPADLVSGLVRQPGSRADGATVCDKPDHGCLIAYGSGQRIIAVQPETSSEEASS